MKSLIVATLVILGSVWCQDDLLSHLPDPSSIPNLQDININDIETAVVENYTKDAVEMLKQKCANVSGGDEVFNELEGKAKSLQTFLTDSINITQVMLELNEAKKTGSMDEVFAKYCARKPDAMKRLREITDTFKKCLLPEEQVSLEKKVNLTEKMVHFLCDKDGDKIAMFIANGGEECLQSKFEGLQGCKNKSSGSFSMDNIHTMTLVQIDEKVCEEFPAVQECVVTVLEECKIKTPANIVGALFRYLRKNMDCDTPQKDAVVATDGRSLNDNLVQQGYNRVKRQFNQTQQTVQMRIERKCQKNSADLRAFSNLTYFFDKFRAAFKSNVFVNPGHCLHLKKDTELEMDDFLKSLKICLSPKEDFIPTFIRNAIDGIFSYLCADDGSKLREYRNAKGLQCLFNTDSQSFSNCAKPSTTAAADAELNHEEFCQDITHLRKCIKKELLPRCNQDPTFESISREILKIADGKCAGYSIFVNTFLVIALVLFHVKRYLF